MKNKKIYLVTGAAGFIGFFLIKKLLENKQNIVLGLDNLNNYYDVKLKNKRLNVLKKSKNFKFYKIDLENTNKILNTFKKIKIDCVFHLGAQAGVRYSIENPLTYAKSNYIGTLSIFELAKQNKTKKVIYASTSSVYGASKPPFKEFESDTDNTISVYSATKKATEVLASTYNHLFNITTVGLRFFTVYGPYSRPDMAMIKFAKSILTEKDLTLYAEGKLKRGFTYVDDIVDAIVESENIQDGNHLINLGGNEIIEVNTLVTLLEKYLNKKAKIKYLPMQQGDMAETISDQTLAKAKLLFSPKVNFEEGVKRFCEWYLENKTWLLKLKDSKQ